MKYSSKIILVFILVCVSLFGQVPDTAWTRTYGGENADHGYSVQQTSDEGYIIAGYTGSYGAGSDDFYLIKTNSSGDTLWTSVFGGEFSDIGRSVQQTDDNGYIMAGTTNSYDPYWGSYDVFLLKSDANGNEDWHKTIRYDHDSSGTEEWASSVKQTSDGGYILAGFRNNYDQDTLNEVLLVKTDDDGNVSWSKLFGGEGRDWANSVQQTSDGGYIIAGWTESFGVEFRDVYLIKTDGDGNEVWSRTFGSAGYDEANCVCQTDDGGYIITGVLNSADIYLIKTDTIGNEIWSKTFGGAGFESAYSVRQTSDKGYIIAGVTTSFGEGVEDVYIVKTDSSGDEVWSKTVGGSDDEWGYSVWQTTDGGYIAAGVTQSMGSGSNDVYVVKLEPEESGVEEKESDVLFSLFPAEPNPFSTRTFIRYELTGKTEVNISVYNLFGQRVRDLYSGEQSPGFHTVRWDGIGNSGAMLPTGIYFFRVKTGKKSAYTKILLVR